MIITLAYHRLPILPLASFSFSLFFFFVFLALCTTLHTGPEEIAGRHLQWLQHVERICPRRTPGGIKGKWKTQADPVSREHVAGSFSEAAWGAGSVGGERALTSPKRTRVEVTRVCDRALATERGKGRQGGRS